jgi:RNA polymerase sigma-70 factor, ECF subfamily
MSFRPDRPVRNACQSVTHFFRDKIISSLNYFTCLRNLSSVEGKPLDQIYDALLILRVQAGDEIAFTELVRRFSPRLRYFLSSLASDQNDVDDLLQNVWLDVYRGIERLTNPAAFPAWIYRIARSRVARQLCRQEPLESFPLEEVPDEPVEFTAGEAAAVHVALNKLTPEHREVLVLRFLNDLSYSEIAEVIGVPVGTVRSRLYFAKKMLRTILETSHDASQSRR